MQHQQEAGVANGELLHRSIKATDYPRLWLGMVAYLWTAYGVSNHREVRALQQMQRYALASCYETDAVPVNPGRREVWLTKTARRRELLLSPPVDSLWIL